MYSDPFGLKADTIKFAGDDEETLKNVFAHAKRALGNAAAEGDADASATLKFIGRMEQSSTVYTFVGNNSLARSGEPLTGRTDPSTNTMEINVARIGQLSETHRIGITMMHELGHMAYASQAAFPNTPDSNRWATDFDNAYRGSVGFALKQYHGHFPVLR